MRPLIRPLRGVAGALALLAALEREVGHGSLWVKCDDRSGPLYGGNKPRIVNIDGMTLEAELGPNMLFTVNEDKPGHIGRLGNLLDGGRVVPLLAEQPHGGLHQPLVRVPLLSRAPGKMIVYRHIDDPGTKMTLVILYSELGDCQLEEQRPGISDQ